MILADADPSPGQLLQRIRSWDTAMTQLKTAELLAEFPSKRLLMKYTQGFIIRADTPGDTQVCYEEPQGWACHWFWLAQLRIARGFLLVDNREFSEPSISRIIVLEP